MAVRGLRYPGRLTKFTSPYVSRVWHWFFKPWSQAVSANGFKYQSPKCRLSRIVSGMAARLKSHRCLVGPTAGRK